MKIFTGILFFMVAWHLGFSQTGTISGKVTDSKTGEPLPFCNVFISNSTIATTTDFDGNYVLENVPEGELELGFSFVGYQAVQKPASVKPGSKLTFNVALVSTEQELSDIEVKASRDKAWERELRRFKNYFLGNDNFAAQCEILNPWVIDFPGENSANDFKATAYQPIEIRNEALGYKITFDLREFFVNQQFYRIAGATRFVELDTSNQAIKDKWAKNRTETYLKSPMNMFRAMISNRHNQEGFFLYGDKPGGAETRNMRTDVFANELGRSVIEYKPENLVGPGRRPGEYRINLKGRIEIHFEKGFSNVNTYKDAPYPISWLEVNGGYVYVTENGMVINQKDLTFSGDMDKRKVSTLLPFDFKPNLPGNGGTLERNAANLQEKVYLHLDRPYYYQGDQLFFKGYVNYTNPDYKKELSRVLYVEVISKDRDVVIQKKFKIDNGQIIGDIFLPDTLSQKEYYLRAYTNWNRNYGPDSYFVKALPVISAFDRVTATSTQELSYSQKVAIETDKLSYGKREKVSVKLTIRDQTGDPVSANLSVSVIDAEFVSPIIIEPTIATGLGLLEVPVNINTEKFLFPVERDLSIKGQFTNDKGKPESVGFTAYFNNFTGSTELKTDSEGRFVIDQMDYYGPLDFVLMAQDRKGNSTGKFKFTPVLAPPFFVPATTKMPRIFTTDQSVFQHWQQESEKTIDLSQVTVEETKESPSRAIYGKADYVVKGVDLMRGGNTTDFLQSLKQFVPGMTVTTLGQVRLRGGAASANVSQEPMVMLDGAILPGNSVASNLAPINPNDVDRVEIVSRTSSMMGDQGRNGVIAVYLKKGDLIPPISDMLQKDLNSFVIEGFSAPGNFFVFDYDQLEDAPASDERATLYWNPQLITDPETGQIQVVFYTNDSAAPKIVMVEGVDQKGNPIYGRFQITVKQ
jgi:hypothetical protein